jgi:isopentenyl phosphate kinase
VDIAQDYMIAPSTMIFLKLGGSLITDKTQGNTPRLDVLKRLAHEIAHSQISYPKSLLLGHGSGSFGHAAAKKHGTRQGVHSPADWRGFAEVSVAAARLNRIVADCLHQAGLPVISVLPSASVVCVDGVLSSMDTQLIQTSLAHGLTPLVMGDVALDTVRGGTIVSTEEVFGYLSRQFPVTRILLAGETEGVYERYSPQSPGPIIPNITPQNWAEISSGIGGSRGADVTGGMASKVRDMVALVQANPSITVQIFSGMLEGNVYRALAGELVGTQVCTAN